MTTKTTFDPVEAAGCVSHLAEVTDRGQMAALALARPVLQARRNQLEREQLRLRTRYGDDDPRVAALDTSIALASARIREVDVATEVLVVDTPEEPDEGGAVFGRVTEEGVGRSDLVVSVVDGGGKVTGFGCTGPKGAFAVKVPKGQGLRLRVTDKPGAVLWRDSEAFEIDDGDRIRREIDLSAAGPECPKPGDDTGEVPKTALVPDLVGRGEAEAQRLLHAAGLVRGKRGEEEAPDRVGRVVSQAPEAGREVPRGSAVDIVVGVEGGFTMPDLTGLKLEEALARIKALGLKAAEPTFSPSADFEGRVIQHTPLAGSKVKAGDTVALLVGSKPQLTMPDLRGMKQEEAEKRVKELGLKLGETSFIDDAERAGLVIRHQPLPGVNVDPGSQVILFVGRKPQLTMPDLRGMKQEEAEKRVDELNLKLGEITFIDDAERVGLVVRHQPTAGAAVAPGNRVTLFVGRKPQSPGDARKMPDLVGQQLEAALKVLKSDGLKVSETVFVKDPDKAGLVVRQEPAAGKTVTPDSKIVLTVASGDEQRDLRSVVMLAAQDPAVERTGLDSAKLLQALKARNVNSLDRLKAVTANDAQVREVFGLDTAANAKRLRAALRAVMALLG